MHICQQSGLAWVVREVRQRVFFLFRFDLRIVCFAASLVRWWIPFNWVEIFFLSLCPLHSFCFSRIFFYYTDSPKKNQFFCLKASEWYTWLIQPQNRLNDQINPHHAKYPIFRVVSKMDLPQCQPPNRSTIIFSLKQKANTMAWQQTRHSMG